MIQVNAMRGDIYEYILEEDPYIVLYDVEKALFGQTIKPVDVRAYEEDLNLIVQWISVKAAHRPVVWYMSFSAQNGELDTDVGLLCDLLVKHLDGKETSDWGKLTLFIESDDDHIFDRFQEKLPEIEIDV